MLNHFDLRRDEFQLFAAVFPHLMQLPATARTLFFRFCRIKRSSGNADV
ncbi:hypothetical protein [Xenorhabdus bovienii]